jgi:hypothetical protein
LIKDCEKNNYKIQLKVTSHDQISIDDYIENWLNNDRSRLLAILGSYGSGKTHFSLHLANNLAERYLKNSHSSIVPIYIPLRRFIEIPNVELLIKRYWDCYGRGDFNFFRQLILQGEVLLILDGFDEMSKEFREGLKSENFKEIRTIISDKSKVIITSRNTYFENNQEEEESFNIAPEIPRNTGLISHETTERNYEIIYLKKLDTKDIKQYFLSKFGDKQGNRLFKLILTNKNLLELAKTPILLDVITKTLPEILKNKGFTDSKFNGNKLYEKYTGLWLEREKWRLDDPKVVFDFIENLSIYMALRGELYIEANRLFEKLHFFSQTKLVDKELDDIQSKIKNCTFLNRDGDGLWSFIHKSFLEYFCARKCFQMFLSDHRINRCTFDMSPRYNYEEKKADIFKKNSDRILFHDFLQLICPLAVDHWIKDTVSRPGPTRTFFSEMLEENNLVVEFDNYIARQSCSEWGYFFFEENKIANYLSEERREQLRKIRENQRIMNYVSGNSI